MPLRLAALAWPVQKDGAPSRSRPETASDDEIPAFLLGGMPENRHCQEEE